LPCASLLALTILSGQRGYSLNFPRATSNWLKNIIKTRDKINNKSLIFLRGEPHESIRVDSNRPIFDNIIQLSKTNCSQRFIVLYTISIIQNMSLSKVNCSQRYTALYTISIVAHWNKYSTIILCENSPKQYKLVLIHIGQRLNHD